MKKLKHMKRRSLFLALLGLALAAASAFAVKDPVWRCWDVGAGCTDCWTHIPDTHCSAQHLYCDDGWEYWEITCTS